MRPVWPRPTNTMASSESGHEFENANTVSAAPRMKLLTMSISPRYRFGSEANTSEQAIAPMLETLIKMPCRMRPRAGCPR